MVGMSKRSRRGLEVDEDLDVVFLVLECQEALVHDIFQLDLGREQVVDLD